MFKYIPAPDEEVDKRKKHCEECEHNIMKVCKKCGCIIRLKVLINSASCPVGKW